MEYRIEKDSMGEVKVPADVLWGAQTERSRKNFRIGGQIMPYQVIVAMVIVKKCAAVANWKSGKLSTEKKEAICKACDRLLKGEYISSFPLVVWQTGSGTQSNMNVNEVVANLGSNQDIQLHPNDDVNMSQSTNDVFPTAIHIASVILIERKLIPSMEKMIVTLKKLEGENAGIVKVGRTHLQDATPIAFSQEISGWRNMIETSIEMLKYSMVFAKRLAIGGTAVGTGINTPKNYCSDIVSEIRKETGIDFVSDDNKFHALQSRDSLCNLHGTLKTLATNLMKIANDIRHLASGPRAGLGEIAIPANEPGSSIMPGKINPTQCEAMTMVVAEVIGNDATMSVACASGNFELNVFMPVMAFKMIESIKLLRDSIDSFERNCLDGLKANKDKMKENLENSLMIATALSPVIGYDNSAKLVKFAHEKGIDLQSANETLQLVEQDKMKKVFEEATRI